MWAGGLAGWMALLMDSNKVFALVDRKARSKAETMVDVMVEQTAGDLVHLKVVV